MAEEEQLRESLKNHPHLTLDELREFKELFNLVRPPPRGMRAGVRWRFVCVVRGRTHTPAYTLPCPPPAPVLASRRATQVDEDKGGSISPQELGSLMETLGLKPNQEELDAMIREIDEDGNGEIEFDEFVQVAQPQARSRPRMRRLAAGTAREADG